MKKIYPLAIKPSHLNKLCMYSQQLPQAYALMRSHFLNFQLANFSLFHSIKRWCYHFQSDWEIIAMMIALKLDRFITLDGLISLSISSRSFCCESRLNILLQGLLLSLVISVTSLDDELVNLFLVAYESRGRFALTLYFTDTITLSE